MKSLQSILSATCRVCNVTINDVRSRKRTTMRNIARGLYLVIAAKYGHRIIDYSTFINRSHCSCTITRQHYEGYIKINDKFISNLYTKALNEINNSNDNE